MTSPDSRDARGFAPCPPEATSPSSPTRFVALDSWRGLAALGVAFFHIHSETGLAASQWHDRLDLAVDFFFVLSGFVIAGAYGERLARGFPPGVFLWLRIGRIWPLHAAVLTLYVLMEVGIGAMGWLHSGQPAFTGRRDPLALVWSLMLLQAWLLPGQFVWSPQAWSISIEAGLYVFAALAFRWLKRGAIALGLAIAVAALLADRFHPALYGDQWWAMRGFAGFGLGMAAHRVRGRVTLPSGRAATALELALILALALLLQFGQPLIVADPLFFALVVVFAAERGAVSRLLMRGPFVFLGAVSYALYLTHGFVLGRGFDLVGLAERLTGQTLLHARDGADFLAMPGWAANLVTLGMLAPAVGLAWLGWRWIEEPARRWSREQVPEWTGALDDGGEGAFTAR